MRATKVYFVDEDAVKLAILARKRGMSLSGFLRFAALQYARRYWGLPDASGVHNGVSQAILREIKDSAGKGLEK